MASDGVEVCRSQWFSYITKLPFSMYLLNLLHCSWCFIISQLILPWTDDNIRCQTKPGHLNPKLMVAKTETELNFVCWRSIWQISVWSSTNKCFQLTDNLTWLTFASEQTKWLSVTFCISVYPGSVIPEWLLKCLTNSGFMNVKCQLVVSRAYRSGIASNLKLYFTFIIQCT